MGKVWEFKADYFCFKQNSYRHCLIFITPVPKNYAYSTHQSR